MLHVFRGWIARNYHDLLYDRETLQTFEDFLYQEQDNDAVSKQVEACIRAIHKCAAGNPKGPRKMPLALGISPPAPEPCLVLPAEIDILNVCPALTWSCAPVGRHQITHRLAS